MIESIPAPAQVFLWPLVGAAIILLAGRYLPNWARRLLAAAAALASWLVLWRVRSGDVQTIQLFWEPINFFRMSPLLSIEGPTLLTGLALAGATAACVLAIRGPDPSRSTWHGLVLVSLAGALIMALAGNLLTLAMGSALIDIALIALALSDPDSGGRTFWRMAVPGTVSTLMLFFAALLMDVRVGHAVLGTTRFPAEVLLLLGLAALLRLSVYPLHPRELRRPEDAVTLLVPLGAGIYLLAQTQGAASSLAVIPWAVGLGCAAMIAGAFLTWSRAITPTEGGRGTLGSPGPDWLGTAIHQTGFGVGFVILAGPAPSWPLVSLTVVLASLAVLWEASLDSRTPSAFRLPESISVRLGAWGDQAQALLTERAPAVERLSRWWKRWGLILLLVTSLASLAGLPFTAGAVGRWSFYAFLLKEGTSFALLVAMLADTMLAASLWLALASALKQESRQEPTPTAILALVALNIFLIIAGIAPNALFSAIGLQSLERPSVSVWGLGLVTVLPWLLGGWLARSSSRLEDYAAPARHVVGLDWLFRAGDWLAQRLARGIGWLGLVGEGEGWWGWALVILAMGAMFLSLR